MLALVLEVTSSRIVGRVGAGAGSTYARTCCNSGMGTISKSGSDTRARGGSRQAGAVVLALGLMMALTLELVLDLAVQLALALELQVKE